MNILEAEILHPMELWLVDINPYSLKLTDYIMKSMAYLHKKRIEVKSTTERKEALPNADYVLISLSVGMQETEWYDIHIPLKFGMPQNTGDTVGPGGILRGVRTVPVIYEMLKDINELCPNAIVLNYTNPQGTTMLGAKQAAQNVQSIGLCHEFFSMGTKKFARFLHFCGVELAKGKEIKLLYGGLNHFAWVTKFEYDGKDIYPQMREKAKEAYETGKFGRPYNYYILDKYGYLNYVEDRHITEFLPRYYNYFNHNDKPFGITPLRNVMSINRQRRFVYSAFRLLNWRTSAWIIKFGLRPMAGGEKALMMVKDLVRNIPRHHVCNVINNGTIPSLPDNCIIEVPAYFKNGNLIPAKIGALPGLINDWVKVHAECQQLVVDASLSGDPEDLLKALLADPMCQFIEDDEKIEDMMWNLLYYQADWLPNFSESILSHRDLLKRKYIVKKKELITHKIAQKEKYSPKESIRAKSWPNVP